MQLGLMAKLIGRPVEVKALPLTGRYAPATLRWEAGKGIAGAAGALAVLRGRETIAWGELEGFRLHFYGFGRQARTGTLEVRLTARGRRIKADSALDHFPTLLVHAAQAARTRGLALDPTT